MYLVTFHSYGRQGCNESGPLACYQTLQKAEEFVFKTIQHGFPEEYVDDYKDMTLSDFKFEGKVEDEVVSQQVTSFEEVASYAEDAGEQHWSYDYEVPLYTIWDMKMTM